SGGRGRCSASRRCRSPRRPTCGSSRRATDVRKRSAFQSRPSLVQPAPSGPVLLVLMMGAFYIGLLPSQRPVAGHPPPARVRLAPQLGNGLPRGLTPSQTDAQVVQGVLAVANPLNFATVTGIDIYAPTATNGVYNSATDLHDSFNGSGTQTYSGFPASSRSA